MTFNDYIEQSRFRPFSWGDHDCITFANKACALQRGKGFADEFLGEYTTAKGALITYRRWLRSTKHKDLVSAVDSRLTRLNTTLPPIGSIVAEPYDKKEGVLPIVFGVCIGRVVCFVGTSKLSIDPVTSDMMFWGVTSG